MPTIFKQIKIEDQWGNIEYYVGGEREEFHTVDRIYIEWPNGHRDSASRELKFRLIRKQIPDHGHTYQVDTKEFGVELNIYELIVWVPLSEELKIARLKKP